MRTIGNDEILLDRMTMITSETDARGIIVYANEDFCAICGYTKEEMIGRPHNMIRHPDMPKAAFADLWDTVKGGRIWNGMVKNRTKDGRFYWVNATVYPMKKNGETRYISVRRKPTDEEVATAIKLYEEMV